MCEYCVTRTVDRRQLLCAAGALVLPALFLPNRATLQLPEAPTTRTHPTIRPRSDWADSPDVIDLPTEDVKFYIVHHSATHLTHTVDEVPQILRDYHGYHTSPEKGWPDMAYNFLIDRFGVIWEGRTGSIDRAVRGDATGGNQGFSQLICLIGDFTSELPTDAALSSLTLLMASLSVRDGVDVRTGATTSFVSRGSNRWPAGEIVTSRTIVGHRDMSLTSCPGDTFYPVITTQLPSWVEKIGPLADASGQLAIGFTG